MRTDVSFIVSLDSVVQLTMRKVGIRCWPRVSVPTLQFRVQGIKIRPKTYQTETLHSAASHNKSFILLLAHVLYECAVGHNWGYTYILPKRSSSLYSCWEKCILTLPKLNLLPSTGSVPDRKNTFTKEGICRTCVLDLVKADYQTSSRISYV